MKLKLTAALMIFSVFFNASASYEIFCELKGKVVSEPVESDVLSFDFFVEQALDIELKDVGRGNKDCYHLQGKTVSVVIAGVDFGNIKSLSNGARISLQRYDVDVVDHKTGEIVRSVRYVHKADVEAANQSQSGD